MLLKDKQSGDLIKVTNVQDLFNPVRDAIEGRIQSGQNEQLPHAFKKQNLVFPSGETLPQCWVDANYQEH
jgi:hypothetical protein